MPAEEMVDKGNKAAHQAADVTTATGAAAVNTIMTKEIDAVEPYVVCAECCNSCSIMHRIPRQSTFQ